MQSIVKRRESFSSAFSFALFSVALFSVALLSLPGTTR